MSIDQLVNLPSRIQPADTFITNANAIWPQLNTFATQANSLAGSMNSAAAGSAYAIAYTFSTTTTDADPGNGIMRLGSATQNTSTALRLDLLDTASIDWTSVIDTFDASSSVVKGQIRLVKMGDATKWLTFNVAARSAPSGYRNLTVTNTGGSAASPFINGDSVMLFFTRTGDVGSPGTIVRRATSIASSATPTPDSSNTDIYIITALAVAPTFGPPAGSPADGQGLMIRIKDNGTARALAFNVAYYAGTSLVLPSTTIVGTNLYLGFTYNVANTRWDLVAVLFV
jgi:hypothetical protein